MHKCVTGYIYKVPSNNHLMKYTGANLKRIEGASASAPQVKRGRKKARNSANSAPAPSVVDITPLKRLATERLPQSSPLREVLMNEPDDMTMAEYLVKISIWQMLLNMERTG